jgi:Methyltransferase domain
MAGSFGGIVLSDVFEHLVKPSEVLRRLATCLAPGGRLYMVTGLADAVYPRSLIAEHWYFRIAGHLQMLSRRHLYWLSATFGLEVASVEVMSHYRRDLLRYIRQSAQATLYETVKLAPNSVRAALVRTTPGLKRASSWTNLPATDQRSDHVVAVLVKKSIR